MGILRNKNLHLSRAFFAVVRTSVLVFFFCALFIFSSCAVKLNESTESLSSSVGISPTVLSVLVTNSDGGYVVGDIITVQVTFSEAVTVDITSGTPILTLEMGTIDRDATYVSGSGTSVLTFTYTLVSGDQNADLDYQSTAALSLNNGKIKSAAAVDATLTLPAVSATGSISDNQAVVVCAQTTHTGLGAGTRTDPHILCQANQLASVGANSGDWGLNYKLMHDIDLTGYTQTADGTQWIPIGTSAIPYTGIFDGNFKTISNLTYNDFNKDYVSIIGYMNGGRAEVKNLTVSGLSLSGNSYTAGVVGYLDIGRVFNVSVSGTINADNQYIGGISGYLNSGGLISDSMSSVSVLSTHNSVAGIVGASKGHIFNSYNTGSIQGGSEVGGISGSGSGTVANVYNSGNITGSSSSVGGVSGSGYVMQFSNCFSTGNVTGVANAGSSVGPLVGNNAAAVSWDNCYYSSSAVITNTGTGNATNTTGGSSTAIANFNNSANAPLSSWNFTDTWNSTGAALPTLAPTFLSSTWGTCADHQMDSPFAGGAGTVSNPYLICTATQMNTIGSNTTYWTGKHFKLMEDISLAAYTGTQFNIIGTIANKFYLSTFDGNSKVISDFTFTDGARNKTGLFGYILSSLIQNLGLSQPNITGRDETGAFAGYSDLSTITNSFVNGGVVSGNHQVGGMFGYMGGRDGFRYGYSSAAVIGTSDLVGGSIGFGNGYIRNAFSTGNVTAVVASVGTSRSLGLDNGGVGVELYYNSNSTCTNCSAAGIGATGIDVGGVQPSTYFYDKTKAPLSSWDFTNTWLENAADYPSFQP